MSNLYNVYCDESCHLEQDHISIMVLGAIWCPQENISDISNKIRNLKERHGFSKQREIKWVKVSPGGLSFYQELVDLFFTEDELHFRAVVIPDKTRLDHGQFFQNHDTWYYKMFFVMLKQIFNTDSRYHVYLDIKDTKSQTKIHKLHEVLANSQYDFDRSIVARVQQVRSHEVELLQLADLLIGALGYLHRGLQTSQAKLALVDHIKKKSNLSLQHTTLPQAAKMNILVWSPQQS
ncbi:MAG: DUF3800 domain-containing protein [Magnetococcales bacterium]|nr:DUF3800 domain-containing protein [Magnetococcales bacterium]